MGLELIPAITSFTGTVVIAGMLLKYMKSRDKITKELADNGHKAVTELTGVIAKFSTEMALNREVLTHICKHP